MTEAFIERATAGIQAGTAFIRMGGMKRFFMSDSKGKTSRL
ncbi:MAG: hypothetical protein OEW04_02380 [Nitrospirota bacterium]|nr:hypothetical protein [Nitrospirota bacterium]